MKNNLPIFGYKTKGYWRDVGNLEEYIEANMDTLKGKLSYIKASDKKEIALTNLRG